MVYEIVCSTKPHNSSWPLSCLQIIRIVLVGVLIVLLPHIIMFLSFIYHPESKAIIHPLQVTLATNSPVLFVFLLIPLLIIHIACIDLDVENKEYYDNYGFL